MKLTQERLKEVLDYDPGTGDFRWKIRTGSRCEPGQLAGSIMSTGYRELSVDGERFLSHRLAWFYVHGYNSENHIDHMNRDITDNRICNLREVSRSCNMRNAGIGKRNKTGVKGVSWIERLKKYQSRIYVDGKTLNLGLHCELMDAAKARWEAEKKYKFIYCDSDSSAYQYINSHGGHNDS